MSDLKNEELIERDSAGFPYRALAMVLIAAAIVCAVIGLFMLVDNGRHHVEVLTKPTESSTVAAAPAAPSTSSATRVAVDKKAISVVVLNNTTKEGYAARTAAKMKESGWVTMSDPANCPEGKCGTQARSTVYYRDTPEAKAAAEKAAKELNMDAAVHPEWLKGYEEDLIVILASA